MDMGALTNLLASLFALTMLAFILLWGYQSYWVDRFRHRVFVLRDELFLEAARGLIPFDHKAYRVVRILMNGHIRFAHHLSLWQPIIFFLFDKLRGPLPESELSFGAVYERAAADLEPEVKAKLDGYLEELNHLATRHIFFALPEFVVLTIPLFFLSLIYALFKMLPRVTFKVMEGFTESRVNDTAFAIGERASRQSPATSTRRLVHQ